MKPDVIVVAFNNPVLWTADYNLQTCSSLALRGNVVVAFLWSDAISIRSIISRLFRGESFKAIYWKRGVLFINPIQFLPFPRFSFIRTTNLFLNVLLLRLFIFFYYPHLPRILWLFSPEFYRFPRLFGSSFISLYDCIDYFASCDRRLHSCFRAQEKRLIQEVDFMIVNSRLLFEKYKKKRSDIVFVPQGFDLSLFRAYKSVPKNKLPFPANKPVIGYVGGINYRLDFNLLNSLVESCKQYNFVFIGPRQPSFEDDSLNTDSHINALLSHTNVYWIGPYTKETIPGLIANFDIALIPYNISLEFNKYSFPLKVFEYFYLGKPVVSTPIKPLSQYVHFIHVGSDANEFAKHIHSILKGGWSERLKRRQKMIAINHSWNRRIDKILTIIKNWTND